MIDLSYLTEEEQEKILAVLKRDAQMKEVEEQRIKKLQKTERDSGELKCLTGEWFYETQSRRHRDRIHGSDIIRASIRDNRPVTILELSQICPEKPSFLNREIKDVFIPPELCGLIEEVPSHPQYLREEETQRGSSKVAAYPQAKSRQNPFNSKISGLISPRKDIHVEVYQTPSDTHQKPADSHQTPANAHQKPADAHQTPADSHQTPSDTHQKPADSHQTPADSHQTPSDTHQKPADSHQTPADSHQKPADSHQTPADAHQKPADAHQTPADSHQTPSDTHQKPADSHQTPADSHQTPPDSHQKPADSHQTPADSHQKPADSHQTPADAHQKPADTHQTPADSQQTPTDSHQTPAEWQLPSVEPLEHEGPADAQSTPATGHHEDSAVPRSSGVSELHASVVDQGGHEEPSCVRATLKQATIRPISISKSLEDVSTLASLSAALRVPGCSVSDIKQMKELSISVPAFTEQQSNGGERDLASDDSFYSERQRKDSTNTNLSSDSSLTIMSSVSGFYRSDFGNVEVKGTIQLAVNYVKMLGEFQIYIVQCRDLAVAEPKRNRSDPYVKCYLLPDKAKLGKRKTSVKKKTLNPTYNEILRYKIPEDKLQKHTLNVSVWHNDTFGRNSFLGEVNIDLCEWNSNNTDIMDYALKGRIPIQSSPMSVNVEMSGEIKVALRFIPSSSNKKTPQTGELHILVKECKNLPSRVGNVFVKCKVLSDTSWKDLRKTSIVKRTANPVFNHTMVYDNVKPEDLKEACAELTVWDHNRLSDHFIGGARLGLGTGKSYGVEVNWMDSTSTEAGLWRRMMESQNEWVEDVIPLRMLIMARTMAR